MTKNGEMRDGERYITLASILEDWDDAADDTSAMEAIAVLPDILPSATPPPYAKEHVMAHLQEPIVVIFVPEVGA